MPQSINNFFNLLNAFTFKEISIIVLFAALVGVVTFLYWRYGYSSNRLYNFLKSNYPTELQKMAGSKLEFTPYEWSVGYYFSPKNILLTILGLRFGITKYGVLDQFKVLKQIEQINLSDSELLRLTRLLRNSIIWGLILIYGTFVIVISLVLLYVF